MAAKNHSPKGQDSTGKNANLNFKVSEKFRSEFKLAAAQFGLKQNELLEKLFRDFMSNHKQ